MIMDFGMTCKHSVFVLKEDHSNIAGLTTRKRNKNKNNNINIICFYTKKKKKFHMFLFEVQRLQFEHYAL